jgi:hypothetical protein
VAPFWSGETEMYEVGLISCKWRARTATQSIVPMELRTNRNGCHVGVARQWIRFCAATSKNNGVNDSGLRQHMTMVALIFRPENTQKMRKCWIPEYRVGRGPYRSAVSCQLSHRQ